LSNLLRVKLHWQILIALVLAVLVGLWADPSTTLLGIKLYDAGSFIGELFLRALKMLVMPLIVASIITGIATVGSTAEPAAAGRPGDSTSFRPSLGRLGLKTASYYLVTSVLAVLLGLLLVDAIRPGIADGQPVRDRIGLTAEVSDVKEQVAGRSSKDVVEVFLRMVPENVLRDAAANEMLGVIFFALLFGFFMTRIPLGLAQVLGAFWQGVYEVMLLITDWVLRFAPIGVFGLVLRAVLKTGLEAFVPLGVFFACVLLGLAVHALLVLPLILRLVGRVSPWRHFRAMAPALLMAFSTASSSATLPLTLECVERGARVSKRVASFTLPLGATVNMDGTALYECVAAMFIAQAYGLTLGFSQQFLVAAIALITSIGVAGIPSASLVAITLILTTIGLPLEAVGLILAVDRILDMCRTAVNVLSDSCAAVVIGKSEGETGILSEA
jgi:proton glutamate symport protein